MQKTILILFLILISFSVSNAENYTLNSPSSNIELSVQVNTNVYYSVKLNGKKILDYSRIALELESEVLGEDPDILAVNTKKIDETISTLYGAKTSIPNRYNELNIQFKKDFALVFRAYDNGIAYRFVTTKKEPQIVKHEVVEYRFPSYCWGWIPEKESYETDWKYEQIFGVDKNKQLYLPLVIEPIEFNTKIKVAITESDLFDYPSLLLKKSNNMENWLVSSFQKYPLETKQGGFNNFSQVVIKAADFVAKTEGSRAYPWRMMIITENDAEFADNDLVYLLAEAQTKDDWSWVKPGKVAWDWWHDYNIKGADFETGINTQTYLYHIDFAAKNNIPYVNIDWKWSDPLNIFQLNTAVDMQKISNYAKEKNVRLFLWCVSYTLDKQLEPALDLFSKWGIAGIKIDFFDREDQLTNRMYERIAKAAAKRKILVNFHGCTKPTGLHRKYPNIVNYEAVKGLEGSIFGTSITPDLDLKIPFIRQICGPYDYTPGAMRNFSKGMYRVSYPAGSQGTRTHQLAMYVVYNMPIAMLCDMPTAYEAEPEYTTILSQIPTAWDETRVLQANFGNYIVIARRKADTWYIGAMTNWTEREIAIPLSFISNGNFNVTVVRDGLNANKLATEYVIEKQSVNKQTTLNVTLKRGGGALVVIAHEK